MKESTPFFGGGCGITATLSLFTSFLQGKQIVYSCQTYQQYI